MKTTAYVITSKGSIYQIQPTSGSVNSNIQSLPASLNDKRSSLSTLTLDTGAKAVVSSSDGDRNEVASNIIGKPVNGVAYIYCYTTAQKSATLKKIVEHGKPRGAKGAYCIYKKVMAEKVRNGEVTDPPEWKDLSDAEKKPYFDMETEDRRRCEVKMDAFKKTIMAPPKKAGKAYSFFVKDKTRKNQAWKTLSDEDKKVYERLAKQDEVRYQQEFLRFQEWNNRQETQETQETQGTTTCRVFGTVA